MVISIHSSLTSAVQYNTHAQFLFSDSKIFLPAQPLALISTLPLPSPSTFRRATSILSRRQRRANLHDVNFLDHIYGVAAYKKLISER